MKRKQVTKIVQMKLKLVKTEEIDRTSNAAYNEDTARR